MRRVVVPSLALSVALLTAGVVQAAAWTDYSAAFPPFPCSDGWSACKSGNQVISPDMIADSSGMPSPSDMRLGWWDLEPASGFSPFPGLSPYGGETYSDYLAKKAGTAAAAPEPVAAPVEDPAAAAARAAEEARQASLAEAQAKANADAKKLEEELERKRAEQEARLKREQEEAAKKAEDEARKAAEKAGLDAAAAEAKAKAEREKAEAAAAKKAEEERRAREAEEAKLRADAEAKRKAEEEAAKKAAEEAAAKAAAEAAKAAEEAAAKAKAEADAKAKAEAAAAAAAAAEPKPGTPEPAAAAAAADESCDDLIKLEPAAMMGKLTKGQGVCLEQSLQTASKQTEKDKISRILMADAYSKQDTASWEKLVQRHLQEINQSDPDLCYKYAQHLSKSPSKAYEVIKWSDVALENRTVWTGDKYTSRVYTLYKMKAAAAQSLWQKASDKHAASPNDATKKEVEDARSQTKVFAREWYEYAKVAGKDPAQALALCESAAGTKDYCTQ